MNNEKKVGFTNVNGISLVIPESFSGILPVSPYNEKFDFEVYSFLGLKNSLKDGDTAFDIGSSYGVMSVLMAKLVGENGQIISFEANPEVMEKANDLVKANYLNNVKILNLLVGESSGAEMDFYAIPGTKSVASTVCSRIQTYHPDAVKKRITTVSIDDFCEKNKLIPKCLKIDIEGAEYIAVKGMERILKTHMPDLVIETHGYEILGIEGSLRELMKILESFGYEFFDLRRGKPTTTSEYTLHSPHTSTVLASTKLKNEEFSLKLKNESQEMLKNSSEVNEIKESIYGEDIAEITNAGGYREVIEILQDLPIDSKKAYEQYYFALSLQATGFDYQQALIRYNHCLENLRKEFSPFWIYYNRGALYYKLGNVEKALEDLNKAKNIYPNHPELKTLLTLIIEKNPIDKT